MGIDHYYKFFESFNKKVIISCSSIQFQIVVISSLLLFYTLLFCFSQFLSQTLYGNLFELPICFYNMNILIFIHKLEYSILVIDQARVAYCQLLIFFIQLLIQFFKTLFLLHNLEVFLNLRCFRIDLHFFLQLFL